MNVNIDGQRLSLKTDTAADPHVAARKFMKANNLEDKFLNTLVEIISDQQRQIINQYWEGDQQIFQFQFADEQKWFTYV